MITSSDVGRRIRAARVARGWTQSDLGLRLARPRTYAAVSDIERGRTRLSVEEIAEFAVLLGRTLSEFFADADAVCAPAAGSGAPASTVGDYVPEVLS